MLLHVVEISSRTRSANLIGSPTGEEEAVCRGECLTSMRQKSPVAVAAGAETTPYLPTCFAVGVNRSWPASEPWPLGKGWAAVARKGSGLKSIDHKSG